METTTKVFVWVGCIFFVLLGLSLWGIYAGVFSDVFQSSAPPPVEYVVLYAKAFQGARFDAGVMEEVPAMIAFEGKNFSYTVETTAGDWAEVRIPKSVRVLESLAGAPGFYNLRMVMPSDVLTDGHRLHYPLVPYARVQMTVTPARLVAGVTQAYAILVNVSGYARATGVCFDWTPGVVWATLEDRMVSCSSGWENVSAVSGGAPNVYQCVALENETALCGSVEQGGRQCVLAGSSVLRRLQGKAVRCYDGSHDYTDVAESLRIVVKTDSVLDAQDRVWVYVFDKDQFFDEDTGVEGLHAISFAYRAERDEGSGVVDVGAPDWVLEVPA